MKEKKDEEHENDYLSMYTEDEAKNFHNGKKIPTWILRNFSVPQMEQIRNAWREELFNGKPQSTLKLYELMTFKWDFYFC